MGNQKKTKEKKISKETSFIQLAKIKIKKTKMQKITAPETPKESACTKENHKVCGVLDENKNLLCVDKKQQCPINGLIFSKKKEFEKREDKNIYKSISLNDKEAIYFTNKNTKGDIIIQIFALSNERCIIPDEGKLGENLYPLNASKGDRYCQTKIQDIDHDFRYKLLDQYSQEKFYDENLITTRIKKLKGYMAKDK